MAFFDIIIRKKEVIYMSLTAGIVGLPNVGKSTLFNAITKKSILMANYPFATIDPNVGVVIVPDERIDVLKNMYNPERVIPTTYEFTDIAGLVKGASNGEGLGNKFLSHIREVDAVVEVVRCFDDENIIHVDGSVDPIRDIEVINVELVLSDLEIVTSRINRIGKKAMTTKNKDDVKEIELLERIKEALESNIPVRKLGLDEEEKKLISSFNLITLKPIIYALNVEDNDINTGNNYTKLVEDYAKKEGSETAIICAKLESELSELDEEEKKLFLDDLGIKESGVERLINKTYDLLGLATFFTVGKDEVRAWTFKKGSKGNFHKHEHLQITYIAEGSFEFTIGGETKIVNKGDSVYMPSNVEHGVTCLEEGKLVDVFNPMRQDFLK